MNAGRQLHELGQRLWLDNITRDLLDAGTLRRYIEDHAVTGLTSNPTIFEKAIRGSRAYDAAIAAPGARGQTGEELFLDLASADLDRAAELFHPLYARSGGADGWVSLEVSPLIAYDTARTVLEAARLHARLGRPNLFIKIPGTPEGLPAIEQTIFAAIPVNVTLLFSAAQYRAAAEAWLRGVERRAAAGLDPDVPSVASLFVSRWDAAVAGKVPQPLHNRLGIAVARDAYRVYRELLGSERWRRLPRPQKLLFASTGTKDPSASPLLYVQSLAAPDTINTMPEATLLALASEEHAAPPLPDDGGDCRAILAQFAQAGVDVDALALKLQQGGAAAFTASWQALLELLESRRVALTAS
jgi:transaldolase